MKTVVIFVMAILGYISNASACDLKHIEINPDDVKRIECSKEYIRANEYHFTIEYRTGKSVLYPIGSSGNSGYSETKMRLVTLIDLDWNSANMIEGQCQMSLLDAQKRGIGLMVYADGKVVPFSKP